MEAAFTLENVKVCGLPRRQAETLAYTALGRSSKETAKEMAISSRTVEMNLNIAMARLGARNRVHLITQAIAKGALVITEHGRVAVFLLAVALSVAAPIELTDHGRLVPRPVRVRTTRRGGPRDSLDYLFADA
jgi:DNA-binding CsgD family transcriptional regulator